MPFNNSYHKRAGGEIKRLITQGGVSLNQQQIKDINFPFPKVTGQVKVGRNWFQVKQI